MYRSKWIHLSQLHFLDAFVTAKTSRSNLKVCMHALDTYTGVILTYHVCIIIAMLFMHYYVCMYACMHLCMSVWCYIIIVVECMNVFYLSSN